MGVLSIIFLFIFISTLKLIPASPPPPPLKKQYKKFAGKEKNFVYSHLHPTGKLYEANPKPVGIGFGGTLGNERIFIDEDFARVSLRHHAVDKTYQPGSLIPNQVTSQKCLYYC